MSTSSGDDSKKLAMSRRKFVAGVGGGLVVGAVAGAAVGAYGFPKTNNVTSTMVSTSTLPGATSTSTLPGATSTTTLPAVTTTLPAVTTTVTPTMTTTTTTVTQSIPSNLVVNIPTTWDY